MTGNHAALEQAVYPLPRNILQQATTIAAASAANFYLESASFCSTKQHYRYEAEGLAEESNISETLKKTSCMKEKMAQEYAHPAHCGAPDLYLAALHYFQKYSLH